MEIKKTQLLIALFMSAVLVGCGSNTTKEDTSDADAAAAAEAQRLADAEAARLAAEEEERRRRAAMMASLKTVFYFDFDQATLSASTRADLDAQIAVLKDTGAAIRLEGHADERGTREYNMALGERRANAVANYLIVNGIARNRIETVSYGEESPVASGSGESSWSANRRVELK